MNSQFIIVTGESNDLNGWYAPKGTSAQWNCNRWGRDLNRIKHYATAAQAQAAIDRNQLAQGYSPARVINSEEWESAKSEVSFPCPRCGSELEEDADGDMVCADCLYISRK